MVHFTEGLLLPPESPLKKADSHLGQLSAISGSGWSH